MDTNYHDTYFVNEGECVALAPMVGHKVWRFCTWCCTGGYWSPAWVLIFWSWCPDCPRYGSLRVHAGPVGGGRDAELVHLRVAVLHGRGMVDTNLLVSG